ncbi:MAG: HEAT repeat domain-containing protein [Planctomycetes bacterium]|nr:HEAT repeat domain-containing protein [Planctomycetota bacterium]
MKTNLLLPAAAAVVLCSSCWFGCRATTTPAAIVARAPAGAADPCARDTATRGVVRESGAPAGLAAAPGTRLGFDLALANSVAMTRTGADGPPPTASGLQVAAALRLTVLARRPDAMLVRWHGEHANVSAPGAVDPAAGDRLRELAQALERGFDVQLDAVGVPRAIRWDDAASPPARSFVRALVGALTFEFRPERAWSTSLVDAMGEHGFAYEAAADDQGVAIRRERQFFVPAAPIASDAAPPELHGAAAARFDGATGWWTDIAIDESMRWSCAMGATFAATLRGHVRCTAVERVAVDDDVDWERGFVAFAEAGAGVPSAIDPMRAAWAQRLAGRDEHALLRELDGLGVGGEESARARLELIQLLAERLRQDPGVATRLGAEVQAARLSGQVAADVLAALGMAGHAAAQLALAGVFANGLVETGLRLAAVEATVALERPEPGLVAELQRSLYGQPLRGLGGSAMLALGAFAGRGVPIVADLLALEAVARGEGMEPAWFEALGNSGDATILPLVRRQLAATDAVERAWGLTAVRRVRGAEAAALVQGAARDDAAVEVRRAAVEVAGESPEPWSLELLAERAAADADASVRRAACAALLLRAHRDPTALGVLQQRAAAEPDAELRAQLRAQLAMR